MARKRISDENRLKLLREIELQLASDADKPAACRAAGIGDAVPNANAVFVGAGRE